MPKAYEWTINLNGEVHSAAFIPSHFSLNHKLIINGKETVIRGNAILGLTGLEQPVMLGEHPATFVIFKGGKKDFDIAVNGQLTRHCGPYIPTLPDSRKTNAWVFFFNLMLAPLAMQGGVAGIALCAIGAFFNLKLADSKKIKPSFVLPLCACVTVLAWGLLILTMLFKNGFFTK